MVTSAQLEELLGQQAARLEELHKRLEASERSGEALGEKVSSMASELEQLDVSDTSLWNQTLLSPFLLH